ncbi:uroporphyrinogen-III synthase [Fictibacillus macauensis ZFHKF-1]|uniref:Uroporphyrinogen-III synthase n=1 Tax=Fictibacillus macauensis ZFHKF-1 TaxID=1196324 RepID=I8AHZ4_9BACL|nr:uroporphyrinogen-III synthase [Fictibacillus macauensis]EIT85357.1 uroporphyrinogen-III synthase [Fictibacillus macauensis ZFHKF-1]
MTTSGVLAGERIIVTRAAEQAGSLIASLRKEGAVPVAFPVMQICAHDDATVDAVLAKLSAFQWIVFTSGNAVAHFFALLDRKQLSLSQQKIAAVGPKTANKLREKGIEPNVIPAMYEGRALAAELARVMKRGEEVLVPKGNLAKQTVKNELTGVANVTELIVYETKRVRTADNEKLDGTEEAIVFMSPSSVAFFCELVEEPLLLQYKESALAVCVGPVTEKEARMKGFHRLIVASHFTEEGIIEAVKKHG